MENYLKALPGFNTFDYPRRPYQSGDDPALTKRFRVRVPMFLRKRETAARPVAAGRLDPSVIEAANRSSVYYPNPDRPAVFSLQDRCVLRALAKSDPPNFERGDIVCMSFTVSFVFIGLSWTTEIMPLEFVRVAAASSHFSPSNYDADLGPLPLGDRIGLVEGEEIHGELHL